MKIVVLDADPAFGSEQKDGTRLQILDDSPLRTLGELTVYKRTDPSQIITRGSGAEVILTNKVVLGESEFAQLPKLRLVSVLATGVNVVDLIAAKNHGITVSNVPGYSTASTAQHAWSLLLELCSHVGHHNADVTAGGWANSRAFSYFRKPLTELDGLTLGIVGYGAIGQRMASIGRAMGMKVISHTKTKRNLPSVTFVDRETLFAESDVLSLHCPLTESTAGFINKESLSQMKSSALLINVARGPVVDEKALSEALDRGDIAGAATDVLCEEPPNPNNPLIKNPRCLVTPHIAWASEAARKRLLQMTAANIQAFQAGSPQNVVMSPR